MKQPKFALRVIGLVFPIMLAVSAYNAFFAPHPLHLFWVNTKERGAEVKANTTAAIDDKKAKAEVKKAEMTSAIDDAKAKHEENKARRKAERQERLAELDPYRKCVEDNHYKLSACKDLQPGDKK